MIPSFFRFSDEQLKQVSNIFADLGMLLIGSLVIPILTDEYALGIVQIISGLFLTLLCWFMSVTILKKASYEPYY